MKTNVKRKVVLLFTLVMVMTMLPCVAFAASTDPALINTSATGSITVTKYANTDSSATKGDATGTQSDRPTDQNYETLQGAKFVLVKIYDANTVMEYYNGTADTLILDTTKLVKDDSGWKYNNITVASSNVNEGTTNDYGVLTFSNLPVGIYILREITAPAQITVPLAEDSLISIPMVNTLYTGGGGSNNNGNAAWMYNVYVYPKNHESTGTVELTKVDQNNANLQNVVFELYKEVVDSSGNKTWEKIEKTVDNAGKDVYFSGSSSDPTIKTGADGKITLANIPANLNGTQYKLVEVYKSGTSPEGYIINSNPLFFKVNSNNTISWNPDTGDPNGYNNQNTGIVGTPTVSGSQLTITLRNEMPSLTKKVFKNGIDFGTATNQNGNWKQYEEYRLDDTITYSLIAYVPKNVSEITYEITDLPDLGIDDSQNWNDYSVTYADTEAALTDGRANTPLTKGTDYDLESANEAGKGKGFELTINNATAAGKYIQIVYKAHMNSSAEIAGNGNGNIATLTYSKFIGGGDDKYTIKDEARVYTYQYQITKYKDSVADGNKASGVEFNLLYAADGIAIDVYKENDGEYRLWLASSDTDTTKKTTTLVTKADGTILIKGLENGTYYLKETKTINGYNLLSEPFKIDLSVNETTNWTSGTGFTTTGKVVKTYGSTGYNVTDAKGTSTIINKKGFVLPQTGGMGYLLFCTVGILLIGGGAALIFGGRRKKIR